VAEARSLVTRALATRLPPALDAEGRTLLAECALVSGDPKEAARRYAEVARAHGSLPAGENALFAAARAAHTSGQTAEARRLFEQYVARYPNGQFVSEANRRLGQLPAPKQGERK
jgi:TolA-binding protein